VIVAQDRLVESGHGIKMTSIAQCRIWGKHNMRSIRPYNPGTMQGCSASKSDRIKKELTAGPHIEGPLLPHSISPEKSNPENNLPGKV
jgi:hypothetical protein